jgi:CRP-like cAMP-binding protein
MNTTLGQVHGEARRLFLEADYARALRAYDHILAHVPTDQEVRRHIADVLARVGLADEAAQVYRALARHDVRAGHPLPAVVAAAALSELGQPDDELLGLVADTYAAGSGQLARFAVRQAPPSPATSLPAPELEVPEPFDLVADRARQRALDLSGAAEYPAQLHPVPFLSDLEREPLLAVLRSLEVRRLRDGEVVTRQGQPGDALYLLAAGEVRVVVEETGSEREVARLFEGTLFGEMALVTGQPRSASVVAAGHADVLEVSRAALARATAAQPVVREVLDRFARERLIRNLLQTSPLFTPFTPAQQTDLLRRFEGHDVAPGTVVIQQGEPGVGLFVVLTGDLEVVTSDGDQAVPLAELGPGDIFGEMSLLTHQPTNASVRARQQTTLLFLARTYVERLASAIPEVRDYFQGVAAQRARDNSLTLRGRSLPTAAMEPDTSGLLLL